ncbi:YqiA/YcfP family alpha/beta fold hydrolase, partial [Shewanella sp.]|uniref:YqiA/YcfP family alpha/beta fold hydrolase n=1 Tax=Shewanella sp. TaxID=50422 RepID=UPI000E84488E
NKCVSQFREKNIHKAMCIFSVNDEMFDNQQLASELSAYYSIDWDDVQPHKFPQLAAHLPKIKAFKLA